MKTTDNIVKFYETSPGVHTLKELESIGAYANLVRDLVAHGTLEEVARGLYRLTEQEESEHINFEAIAVAIPHAVFCLISALDFHNIGTQRPFEYHIAIPKGKRAPHRQDFTIESYQLSGQSYEAGIEEHGRIKVYSVAKTVADCFKFRNQLGLDVALEALKDVLRNKRATVAELLEMAEVCRVKKVMMPYLESLT
jgi:predicted transcriptional regulator of viral defense system